MTPLRWLLFALCLALDAWITGALVPAGDGVQYAFLAALWAGIVAVGAWLADKAVTIGVILYQVAITIGRAIWDVALKIAGVFKSLFGLLRQFWTSVLKPFVKWTWSQIDRFAGWLKKTFDPVLKFLYKIRGELLKFYEKWFRPIFDAITILRRTLQALAFLRLPWAKELDRTLAELEDRLLAPIRFAFEKINEAINIVNRIVTLDGLLQRLTLLRSVQRDIQEIADIWWSRQTKPRTPAELATLATVEAMPPAERDIAEAATLIASDEGPLAAAARRDVEEWSEWARSWNPSAAAFRL